MFSSIDVSTSALVAQRVRMNTISENLANISTTHNETGQAVPFQARFPIFKTDDTVGENGAMGVQVSSIETDQSEPRYKYEPGNPDAIKVGPKAGYVAYPNINMMTEMTDAMEAARAYEANLGAIEIAKDMANQTLKIVA